MRPGAKCGRRWASARPCSERVATSASGQVSRAAARLKAEGAGLPGLRSVASGGEPLGAEMLAWGREAFGVEINEFYGQTECNAVLGSCAACGVSRSGAIGKAIPGHEVAIIDDDGHVLPPETLGQIAVRRPDPVMFLEYWNKPEATKEKFIGDWMITGDQGLQDEDGYVQIKDRSKDIIISGGENISSIEIEDLLFRHPDILEAAVVAKTDEKWGETPCAFVTLRDSDCQLKEEQVIEYCRDNLAHFKVPKNVVFVELPKTSTGKVQKFTLRELAEDL